MVISNKLEFTDKISAGLVGKSLDQLLKDGTAATRHWVFDYNVETILARPAYAGTDNGHIPEKSISDIVRYAPGLGSLLKDKKVRTSLCSTLQLNFTCLS